MIKKILSFYRKQEIFAYCHQLHSKKAVPSRAMHLESVCGTKFFYKYSIQNVIGLPFLATDPPTIRFCGIIESPQPSSGESKRPFG